MIELLPFKVPECPKVLDQNHWDTKFIASECAARISFTTVELLGFFEWSEGAV